MNRLKTSLNTRLLKPASGVLQLSLRCAIGLAGAAAYIAGAMPNPTLGASYSHSILAAQQPFIPGPTGPKVVFAHYMHCYALGYMWDKASQFRTASRTNVEDLNNWPENEFVERIWWSNRLAAMAHGGEPALAEDFKLAHRAGLDAFALLIGPKHLPDSAFAPAINAVIAMAEHDSIKVLPDLWYAADNAEMWVRYGETIKSLIDQHPNAFYKYDGKPVILITTRSGGSTYAWQNFGKLFDAMGGASKYYVIPDPTCPLSPNGEFGKNSSAYTFWTAGYGWADRDPFGIAETARFSKKPLCWPVHDNYFGGRKGAESGAEGLGSCTYTDQWKTAMEYNATFAEIQTWNDFSEDHCITETNYCGDALIDLTHFWADWYRTGKQPEITQDKLYMFHHRQKVNATLSAATVQTMNGEWCHTPFVDYVCVESMLTKPGVLTVTLGGAEWKIEAPAGEHEWLIYVPDPRTEPDASHMAFTREDSYPGNRKDRTVTVAKDIPAGTPEVTLRREGNTFLTLKSKYPISDSAKWRDLSMIVDETH